MESLYALIIAVEFLIACALVAYIVALRSDVRVFADDAGLWRDGYQGLLEENTRVHEAFDAMKDAHSILQIDYLEQGRDLHHLRCILFADTINPAEIDGRTGAAQ